MGGALGKRRRRGCAEEDGGRGVLFGGEEEAAVADDRWEKGNSMWVSLSLSLSLSLFLSATLCGATVSSCSLARHGHAICLIIFRRMLARDARSLARSLSLSLPLSVVLLSPFSVRVHSVVCDVC